MLLINQLNDQNILFHYFLFSAAIMSEIDELCFHTRLQDTCPDMVRELRSLIRRDVEERDGQILFPR